MFTIVTSILITRPVEDVLAYYLDLGNRVRYSDHVLESEWLGEVDPGPGSSFRVVLRQFSRTIETIRTITVFEPNRLFGYETAAIGIYIRSCQSFRSQGKGALFTIEADYEMPWYFDWAREPFSDGKKIIYSRKPKRSRPPLNLSRRQSRTTFNKVYRRL